MSYKILYRIYTAKHVLERFNLNISYTCEFCALEKETILHFLMWQRDNLECKEQHIIQLFILLGRYHIHKKKWAQGKPNFPHFINDFKL